MSFKSNMSNEDREMRELIKKRKEPADLAIWRTRLDVLWRIAKEDIELRIVSGYYREGGKAPSKDDIVRIYEVSEVTALKVLKVMEDEGIIEKIRGKNGRIIKPQARQMLYDYHFSLLNKRLGDIVSTSIRCGLDKNTVIKLLVSNFDKRKSGSR